MASSAPSTDTEQKAIPFSQAAGPAQARSLSEASPRAGDFEFGTNITSLPGLNDPQGVNVRITKASYEPARMVFDQRSNQTVPRQFMRFMLAVITRDGDLADEMIYHTWSRVAIDRLQRISNRLDVGDTGPNKPLVDLEAPVDVNLQLQQVNNGFSALIVGDPVH